MDVVVALHARGELELESLSEASKACSECWTAAGTWRGMEDCRDGVRTIAGKLKRLLDEGGRTYRGTRHDIPFQCNLLLSLEISNYWGYFCTGEPVYAP